MIDPITEYILLKESQEGKPYKPYSGDKIITVPPIRNSIIEIYYVDGWGGKKELIIFFPSLIEMWDNELLKSKPVTYMMNVENRWSGSNVYEGGDWQFHRRQDLVKQVAEIKRGKVHEYEKIKGDVLVKAVSNSDTMRMYQIVFNKINSKLIKDKAMFHLSWMAHDYSMYIVPKTSFNISL